MRRVVAAGLLIAAIVPTLIHSESVPEFNLNMKELRCLELNIHYEARGESTIGKKAVALVTLNRTKASQFPDSICKVIKQPGQFSWVAQFPDYHLTKVSQHIKQIAFEAMTKGYKDFTNGALYFHNKTVDGFNRRLTFVHGNHYFYR